MSTIYPSNLDTDLEIQRVDDNITEVSGDAINSLRDAVFAIEKTIGTNPQGNKTDLVDRINSVIDDDGKIKSAALVGLGLITLPITNAHIADDAAIEESKLDLDYSTALLNGKIDLTRADIESMRNSINIVSSRALQHYTATEDRHDGYDIDLLASVRGQTNIESSLHKIDNDLSIHTNDLSGFSHAADKVSVVNDFENINTDNVQSAISALDSILTGQMTTHQDTLHTNGIEITTRGRQSDQDNLFIATLASTIFQTNITKATNILQVMRPNVSRVTSKNIDFGALEIGAAQNLRIQAGGIDRSWLDVDFSSIIPTDDLDEVISVINAAAEASHYPISAYNTNGRLTIAHNIPGEEFTIQILSSVSFPAQIALGLDETTAIVFDWSNDYNGAYVGGNRISDLKSLVKIHYQHLGAPLNQISPSLGDLSNYGITIGNEGRILCNITNHSTDSSYNGTYYIIYFPNSSSFWLNENIAVGEFDLEIPANSLNFQNSTNGELYDIFLEYDADGYGKITKQNRISYGTIPGVSLRDVSPDFPVESMSWEIADGKQIIVSVDGDPGIPIDIPIGFIGKLKVFCPDNINFAIFEITGSPSILERAMTVSAFGESQDKLHLSSVHYSGNYGIYTLKFVNDHRQLGGVQENKTDDEFEMIGIEEYTNDLRNNGITSGFDYISNTSTTIKIRGGKAYIQGRKVEKETTDITINDFTSSAWIILLDKYGNFKVVDEDSAGFSMAELISGDSYGDNREYATILEFNTDGTDFIGNFIDKRFIIGKIDKKLFNEVEHINARIDQLQNYTLGGLWSRTVSNDDGYVSSIDDGTNIGFTAKDYAGFSAGNTLVTTRRYEFSAASLTALSEFKALGLNFINLFFETEYTDNDDSFAFGTSGNASVLAGISVNVSGNITEDYATIKTINNSVLPTHSVIERYVVSIPTSSLNLSEHIFFDIAPRIKITGSTYIDGGISGGIMPIINFSNIRVVVSSYSIAGYINENSENVSQSALFGNFL